MRSTEFRLIRIKTGYPIQDSSRPTCHDNRPKPIESVSEPSRNFSAHTNVRVARHVGRCVHRNVRPSVPKIWLLVGESWLGLLIGFVVLWLGGALLYLAFSQLDRIKSEGLKFVAQMLLCLLVTIIVGGIILIVTF